MTAPPPYHNPRPREVQDRLDRYEIERQVRMVGYILAWERRWRGEPRREPGLRVVPFLRAQRWGLK